MAILRQDDERAGRASGRRFAWLALAPMLIALFLVGFIGWVWCSSEPVEVGRYQFIGPRYTRPVAYVWSSGSARTTFWVSAYNRVSVTSGTSLGRTVVFGRGAFAVPAGMQTWVYINGSGPHAPMRQVWQGGGFAILEEVR